MSKINDGGPAFPATRYEQVGTLADHGHDDDSPTYGDVSYPGMSLRDWLAGQALAGLMVSRAISTHDPAEAQDERARKARSCYALADAMLAAREKAGAA